LIRTNFDFAFAVDCISQALFWIYVQDNIQKLYVLSLRGAQEVSSFLGTLNDGDQSAKAIAQQTLKDAAARLGVSEDALRQTPG